MGWRKTISVHSCGEATAMDLQRLETNASALRSWIRSSLEAEAVLAWWKIRRTSSFGRISDNMDQRAYTSSLGRALELTKWLIH